MKLKSLTSINLFFKDATEFSLEALRNQLIQFSKVLSFMWNKKSNMDNKETDLVHFQNNGFPKKYGWIKFNENIPLLKFIIQKLNHFYWYALEIEIKVFSIIPHQIPYWPKTVLQ